MFVINIHNLLIFKLSITPIIKLSFIVVITLKLILFMLYSEVLMFILKIGFLILILSIKSILTPIAMDVKFIKDFMIPIYHLKNKS